jgi:hypothetical protein
MSWEPVNLMALLKEGPSCHDWGPWKLDPDRRVLDLYDQGGRRRYEVDLDRCDSASAVLDWIVQIAGKGWDLDRHAVVYGLIAALDDILNLQAHYCSFGMQGTQDIPRVHISEWVERATKLRGVQIQRLGRE